MVDPVPLQEPQTEPEAESLWWRLLWMIVIWTMLSLSSTLVLATTVGQFLLMLTRGGKPNAELAWFGKRLGDWTAKAIRYQSAADEEKPWPWTPLD